MAQTQSQPDPRNPEHLLSLLTPAQRGMVEARRSHCVPCSQNKKLSIVSVQCDACGCAGVWLIHSASALVIGRDFFEEVDHRATHGGADEVVGLGVEEPVVALAGG